MAKKMLGVSWREKLTKREIRKRIGLETLETIIRHRRVA